MHDMDRVHGTISLVGLEMFKNEIRLHRAMEDVARCCAGIGRHGGPPCQAPQPRATPLHVDMFQVPLEAQLFATWSILPALRQLAPEAE